MLVPSGFPDRRVCVVGLGYVGITLAAVLAEIGFDVIGVERRRDVVDQLRRGEAHIHEPGLEPLLARLLAEQRACFVERIPDGCTATVFIVTVGTPLDGNGRVRLDMVESASREVAERLKPDDLIVMRSTVKLGTTRNVVMKVLDRTGVPYEIAFCPERTLEGQALPELRSLPQIVGGATLAANVRASQLFQFVTPTIVRVSSLEAAEMVKLIDNTQRDVSFAFANEVARICDAAGIGANEVIRAGKLGYGRTNVPLPGPVGGPCLEKDPHIFAESAAESGVEASLATAARRLNEGQPAEVVAALRRRLAGTPTFPPKPVIALLGLAFKGRPPTDDLRGTMARPILTALREAWPMAELRGWDAVVPVAQGATLGVVPAASLEAAFAGAHLVVIANNHPIFATMPLPSLVGSMARPGLVYDFWNNFDARELVLPPGVGYMALGSRAQAVFPG
jgi:nucleotide sugar dehydrogenase